MLVITDSQVIRILIRNRFFLKTVRSLNNIGLFYVHFLLVQAGIPVSTPHLVVADGKWKYNIKFFLMVPSKGIPCGFREKKEKEKDS